MSLKTHKLFVELVGCVTNSMACLPVRCSMSRQIMCMCAIPFSSSLFRAASSSGLYRRPSMVAAFSFSDGDSMMCIFRDALHPAR